MLIFKHIKIFFCILILSLNSLAHNFTVEQKEAIKLFNQGVNYANQKKYEESIINFDKSIIKFPRLIGAYYSKSKVFIILKKYNEAILVCDEALKVIENQPKILAQKALCLYILKNYKESLKVAELAVQYGNELPIAYEMRANAHGALGQYELAIEDYDKALSLAKNQDNSDFDETYLNRFCPLYKLKRYDEALITCNKALEITNDASKLPQIYSKKALVLNKLGQHKEALENAEKALKIDAKDSLGVSEKKIAESKLKKGFI